MTQELGSGNRDRLDRVTLRPWRTDEAPLLVSICDEAEVAIRTPFPTPFPDAYAESFIDGREGYLDLAITGADDLPVGLVSLNLRTRSASYVVSFLARGRGYATGALKGMCQIARRDLGFDTVLLEIEPGNRASEVVAERCGFGHVGSSLEQVEDKGRAYSLAAWELIL